MTDKSKSIVIDQLCRVEGYGGIAVEIRDGKVTKVNMDIFEGLRFFETLVIGRSYDEVTPIVSRICAICSAVHSVTSLLAIEDAFGVEVTPQTKLLRDLLLQGGNIESHALHLFCLAIPDFLGYTGAITLAADHLEKVKMGLALKKLGNTIQEVIGGRAVHPVNAVVGGFGKLPSEKELLDLREQLHKGLEQAVATVDIMASLDIPSFSESPTIYAALKPSNEKYSLLGEEIILSTGDTREIAAYKEVCNERIVAHSHAKHSRFKGKPFMVGALARVMLNGDRLSGEAQKALHRLGLDRPSENILHNNSAQAVELVYSIERSIEIVDQLIEAGMKEEKLAQFEPKAGTGTAGAEAPRGTLYHSYTFGKDGRLTEADVITPTAQNCANLEKDFRATIERLINEPKESLAAKLEMVARAYDPCISCSVH